MTEETELKIPYNDLTRLSIECPTCQAEISIDLKQDRHMKMDWDNNDRFSCAVCKEPFEKELRFALTSFQRMYGYLQSTKLSVSFRIKKSALSKSEK